MTVLVTGATGTVGRPLVGQLLALGAPVRCLTRDPARALLPDGAEVVQGDLADPASLGTALDGVRAAHLITFAGDDYAPVPDSAAIVSGLLDAGASRVTVLAGGIEASPLEEAIAASPLEWTSLAPVEFMANMLEWAEGARTGSIAEGFADVPSTVVHEADIASVAARVLVGGGYGGDRLWITGPEALTVRERVAILRETTGQELELVPLSTEDLQAQWRSYGLTEDDIAFMTQMKTDPPEAGRVPQDTVRRVTGRAARTFRSWAQEHAADFHPESART